MAEKAPELITPEDKIAQAKEYYARGYRNYIVGDFNEAAEDLSRSCELYSEIFGDESEEVAVPNLFYGKTLIELAQMGENKVLALPDQEDDDEDNSPSPKEAVGDDDDSDDDSDNEKVENQKEALLEKNGSGNASACSSSFEPQPGTSSGTQNGNSVENNTVENPDDEANENLQFAWEALEMAARIFQRLGAGHEQYLAEAHYGLGEVSMENQNCSEAIRDYNIAFDIFSKLEPVKYRCLAEIKYKTGLCNYTTLAYDASVADFQLSADFMTEAINTQKSQEQTPEIIQTIEDLTKMREDILTKIADVQETKDMIRKNLMSKGGYAEQSSGNSNSEMAGSSSQIEKPKANDISHLIKRKKPDASSDATSNSDVLSPAKKQAL